MTAKLQAMGTDPSRGRLRPRAAGGKRKGYSAGGIWNPVKPEQPLSGKNQWDTVIFNIPAALLASDMDVEPIGFGGGDSQIWLAEIRHDQPQQ